MPTEVPPPHSIEELQNTAILANPETEKTIAAILAEINKQTDDPNTRKDFLAIAEHTDSTTSSS